MIFRHFRENRLKRGLAVATVAFFATSQFAVTALAAETHRISQKSRTFSQKELSIAKGDIIHFANDDLFIHQVHVVSPTFNFDTPESPPGEGIDVEFSTPGTFEVRCHIHPKMSLKVTVE